jgi:hypothetical protein
MQQATRFMLLLLLLTERDWAYIETVINLSLCWALIGDQVTRRSSPPAEIGPAATVAEGMGLLLFSKGLRSLEGARAYGGDAD